jgi:hypothetical protein
MLLGKELGRLRGWLLPGWYQSTKLVYFVPEAVATREKYFPHPWTKAIVIESTDKTNAGFIWDSRGLKRPTTRRRVLLAPSRLGTAYVLRFEIVSRRDWC